MPRAFELLKIDLFKLLPPWAKIAFKHPTVFNDQQMLQKYLAKTLIQFWWSWCWVLNKSLASVIPQGKHFLFLTRFVATDKRFLNELFV